MINKMWQSPGLGCARCGDCCEHILMSGEFDPELLRVVRDSDADVSVAFIKTHWTLTDVVKDEHGAPQATVWNCDRFDSKNRICTAHDDRPPICVGYPWYDREPGPGRMLPLKCSYAWDIPPWERAPGAQPLLPLEVIQRTERVK